MRPSKQLLLQVRLGGVMVRTLDLQSRGCGSIAGHTLPGFPPFCYHLPPFSSHFDANRSILVTFCCHIVTEFCDSFADVMSMFVAFFVTHLSTFSPQFCCQYIHFVAFLLPLCHRFLPQFCNLWVHICHPFVPSLSPVFVVVLPVICQFDRLNPHSLLL